MDQVDCQGVKYQDDVDCFGDNVIIKRLDGGMLRVKVGRKRSICIMVMRGRRGGWGEKFWLIEENGINQGLCTT